MVLNCFVAALQLSTPFLLQRIIVFIQDQEEDTGFGLMLVGLLVLIQAVAYMITEHLRLYQRMIGCKSTNAMIALIYEKQFKISSATNKKFSQGELVNFV